MIYVVQKLAWLIFKPLGVFFLNFKAEGQGNFKKIKQNQFIVIANHFGYADAFLVSGSVPFLVYLRANFRYMTSPKWIDVYPFIKLCGSYPIYRKMESLEKTLESTEKLIQEGKSLLIFPEGGFAENGARKPARKGIAYLSKKYNLPIIPIAVSGTEQLNKFDGFDIKKMLSRKYNVRSKVGEPFYYSDVAKKNMDYSTVAQKMMDRVNAML